MEIKATPVGDRVHIVLDGAGRATVAAGKMYTPKEAAKIAGEIFAAATTARRVRSSERLPTRIEVNDMNADITVNPGDTVVVNAMNCTIRVRKNAV